MSFHVEKNCNKCGAHIEINGYIYIWDNPPAQGCDVICSCGNSVRMLPIEDKKEE